MKDSINVSLKLIIISILFLVLGTLVAALFYSIYCTCLFSVAGESINLFKEGIYLIGICETLPIIILSLPFIMSLYLIRHPTSKFFPVVTFYLLCGVFLVLLLPFTLKLETKYQQSIPEITPTNNLTAGYFREDNGYLYFFTNVDDNNYADGLCINLNNDSKRLFTFTDVKLGDDYSEYVDSLVQDSFKMPVALKITSDYFSNIVMIASKCANESFITWLYFSSFLFVLVSSVGFRRFSQWRLVNLGLVTGLFIIAFYLNFKIGSGNFFGEQSLKLQQVMTFVPKLINPLCFIINCSAWLLITLVCGIWNLVTAKTRRSV